MLLRTPVFRSLRFRSLADARAWHAGSGAGVVYVLGAGLVAILLKLVLSMEVFLPVATVLVVAAVIVGGAVGTRAQAGIPAPEKLGWDESVRLDPDPHSLRPIATELGGGLASLTLLALFSYLLVFEGGARNLEREGLFAQLFGGVFLVGLIVGTVYLPWSAAQRVRFFRARRAIERAEPAEPSGSERGRNRR